VQLDKPVSKRGESYVASNWGGDQKWQGNTPTEKGGFVAFVGRGGLRKTGGGQELLFFPRDSSRNKRTIPTHGHQVELTASLGRRQKHIDGEKFA